MRFISVVIADPSPLVLHGLTDILGAEPDFKIAASCSDGTTCIEAIWRYIPEIAIMDPVALGISEREILTIASSCNFPTRMVFFVSPSDHGSVATLAAAGASGVISRNAEPETLVRALRLIADGQKLFSIGLTEWQPTSERPEMIERALKALTEREHQIMELVSEGLSNKEIGRRLRITDGTIKVHLHHIFKKLEISNRTVLAALAVSQNRAH